MYIGLFYLFFVYGCVYFLFKKRTFDLFSISFASSVIYFMPAFWGKTHFLVNKTWHDLTISPQVYQIYLFFWLTLFVSTFLFDRYILTVKPNTSPRNNHPHENHHLFLLTMLMVISGFFMLNSSGVDILFSETKPFILSKLNRSYLIFCNATMIVFVYAFLIGRLRYIIAGSCGFFLVLILGMRVPLIIAILAIILLYYMNDGPKRLLGSLMRKQSICIMGLGIFLIAFKTLFYQIKSGGLSQIFKIMTHGFYFNQSVYALEPFTIITTLIASIKNSALINYSNQNILYNSLVQLSPYNPNGSPMLSFNEAFQPELFPEVDYGMASNIFAEYYVAGGMIEVMIFIMTYFILIAFLNRWVISLKNRGGNYLLALVSLASMYLVFYIFRNDTAYTLNLIKRVFMVGLFPWFVVLFLSSVRKGFKKAKLGLGQASKVGA